MQISKWTGDPWHCSTCSIGGKYPQAVSKITSSAAECHGGILNILSHKMYMYALQVRLYN